jgi:hypothetical protein
MLVGCFVGTLIPFDIVLDHFIGLELLSTRYGPFLKANVGSWLHLTNDVSSTGSSKNDVSDQFVGTFRQIERFHQQQKSVLVISFVGTNVCWYISSI